VSDSEALTHDEALAIVRGIADAMHPVVLIGGQALNFWCERYSDEAAELHALRPFTSKDIDFFGDRSAVQRAAKKLGAKLYLPSIDDHTPNSGKIVITDQHGIEREIDFLSTVMGLEDRDIRDNAAPVPDVGLQVLNPILCLESRAHNIIGLPLYYDTPQGHRQMAASIVCARQFIREMAAQGEPRHTRKAHTYAERVARFCATPVGVAIYAQGYEPLDAVEPLPELPQKFRTIRYPQLIESVTEVRKRGGVTVNPSPFHPTLARKP
jgi:hypothetical protein